MADEMDSHACIRFKRRMSHVPESSAVTEEDAQSPEIVSTQKQDEDSMEKKGLEGLVLHSKKAKSQNNETTDSVSSISLTADSISGSFASDHGHGNEGFHDVGLVSDDLASVNNVKESLFSDLVEKEDKESSNGVAQEFDGESSEKKLFNRDEKEFLGNEYEFGDGCEDMEGHRDGHGNGNGLKVAIHVIDETALIDSVSVSKQLGNGSANKIDDFVMKSKCTKSTLGHLNSKRAKEDIDEKKVKRSQRRAKGEKKGLEKKNGYPNKGERTKKMVYSREVMEALRYVNMTEQRKMWKDVHTGLGPVVRKEYDYLASSKHHMNISFNFGKKDESASVLSVVAARGRWNHMNVFAH